MTVHHFLHAYKYTLDYVCLLLFRYCRFCSNSVLSVNIQYIKGESCVRCSILKCLSNLYVTLYHAISIVLTNKDPGWLLTILMFTFIHQ